MGLQEGHPEKDGVMVGITDLVEEVKARLKSHGDLRLSDDVEASTGRLSVTDADTAPRTGPN